jgi:hypothetical protein
VVAVVQMAQEARLELQGRVMLEEVLQAPHLLVEAVEAVDLVVLVVMELLQMAQMAELAETGNR